MKIWNKIMSLFLGITMVSSIGLSIGINTKKATRVEAETATITINGSTISGWTTAQGSQSGSKDGIIITSDNAAINDTQIRLYSGGIHTFTSIIGNIIKAEFFCTASGTDSFGPGKMSLQSGSAGSYSYSYSTGTWTGDSKSFTLSGGESRVYSLIITYTVSEPHVHTPGTPVEEDRVEPTCSSGGSYDSVIYCTECGEELSRECISIPAVDHNYENGVCTFCGAEIPSVVTLDPKFIKTFPYEGITLTASSGDLSNGANYRIYEGETLTITSTIGDIATIDLTYQSSSYDGGGWATSYSPNAASWTSSACTSGEEARITLIVVTLVSDDPEPPISSVIAKRYYSLVTSTDGLVAGAKYIITNSVDMASGFFAISFQQSNNRAAESIVSPKTNIAQVSSSTVAVITLGGSTEAWTLHTEDGFLYAAAFNRNYLKTRAEDSDDNSKWSITFNSNITSIVARGSNLGVMQYNADNTLFSCYTSASQTNVYLYRLDFEETLLGNVSCSGSGSHSFPEGYTWNTDLQGVYNDLPASEKSSLASKSAISESGLERYDYIIGKYNPQGLTTGTDYIHFITDRAVTPVANSRVLLPLTNSINNSTWLVIVISILSISSITVLLIIKKKRIN